MYAELKQKVCIKCSSSKPMPEFRFRQYKNKRPGYVGTCKECEKELYKIWAAKNKQLLKERDFKRNLRSKFGLTLDKYQEMLKAQDFGCAICKAETSLSGRALAVDHCHTTGVIRSLLCNECNTALGLLKENIEIISAALEYVRKFKK